MGRRQIAALIGMLLLLLAGCAAPTPDIPAIDVEERVKDFDADLHHALLHITLNDGEGTALIALNITKDMWVRPFVGTHRTDEGERLPVRSEDYWVLCPWVMSRGLPDGLHYLTYPFWDEPEGLVPARGILRVTPENTDIRRDADGGKCVAPVQAPARITAIAADNPRDGTLLLLIMVRENAVTVPTQAEVPTFALRVGIATRPCSADPSAPEATVLCPPTGELPAEPSLRAAPPLFAAATFGCPPCKTLYANSPHLWDSDCPRCGFTVRDDRARMGAASSPGQVKLNRTGDIGRGLTFVSANADASTFRLDVTSGTINAKAGCRADEGPENHVATIGIMHKEPARVVATMDLAGPVVHSVFMHEIPIDLTLIGRSMSPIAGASYYPGSAGVLVIDCQPPN